MRLSHSSTLAWKIPWTEEPGRLQSMGSLRVGHDWVTSLLLFTFMHWRRKWQPTSVFLPGESQEWQAWWVAVYGVAQSWTRLKRLSSSSSNLSKNRPQLCMSAQSCPTLCDPMDCSPPDSSVHGISQARILEWIFISSSRGSSPPRDWTQVSYGSCIGRQILYHWATGKSSHSYILYNIHLSKGP